MGRAGAAHPSSCQWRIAISMPRLEKQRSHAEKVFIENEKRSKEALEKLRQDYKKEEKIEEVCVAACLWVWLNLPSRDRASYAR